MKRTLLKADRVFTMSIRSIPSEIHTVEEKLERFCRKAGLSQDDIENFGIATTEMVNNAIRHGNKSVVDKKVIVKFEKFPSRMQVTVADSGGGFDPDNIADPLDPENLYKDSGRGIFIVKMLMDDVKFNFTEQGTKVILIKNIKADPKNAH
ncbi:ATP-binding protein [candidate division KSB1 bacterium]|nr:ATP-binding protein [candidate division KSB1 bacterium]RQW04853.1 MAG: ATP-binding protein [candidate division KSB1 bacterium]